MSTPDPGETTFWSAKLNALLDGALATLPTLAGCVGLLLVGALGAPVVRRALQGLVDRLGLEALAEEAGVARWLYRMGMRGRIAALSGRIGAWAVWLIVAYLLVGQLRLPGLTRAVGLALGYLPRLGVAAALGLAGLILGEQLRAAITGEGGEGGQGASSTRGFFGQLAQGLVWTLTGSVVLEQLGFDVALIHGVIEAVYAALALSATTLFALSARATFAQLIARHWIRRALRVGDRMRLGEQVGEVAAFEPMYVRLRVDDAREALLPYDLLIRSTWTLLAEATAPVPHDEATPEEGADEVPGDDDESLP